MPAVLDARLPIQLFPEVYDLPSVNRYISEEEIYMEKLRSGVDCIKNALAFCERIVEGFLELEVDINQDRLMVKTLLQGEDRCVKWIEILEKMLVRATTKRREQYELILKIIVEHKDRIQDLRWKILVRDGLMDLD